MRVNNSWEERQKVIKAKRAKLDAAAKKKKANETKKALDRANRTRRGWA